eukprot:6143654-Karenia_brevis.AAC.1
MYCALNERRAWGGARQEKPLETQESLWRTPARIKESETSWKNPKRAPGQQTILAASKTRCHTLPNNMPYARLT